MSSSPQQFKSAHGAMVPVDKAHPPAEVEREKRERVRNFPPLLQYLTKTCDAIKGLDKSDRVMIRTAQVKAVAFYDGRQDGEVKNGVWVDNPYVGGEIRPEDNQYKIQVDKLNMEMCRARPEFEVTPVDPSDVDKQEAAKFFKHRLDINRERTETEVFKQSENLSLLLKTITYRHTFFDPNAEGDGNERMPKFGQKDGTSMSVTVCRTCEMPQTVANADSPDVAEKAAANAPCENCGDTVRKELKISTSGGFDLSYEDVPGGRVVTVRPDAMAVQLDMQARSIPTSRFLRWSLTLRRCEWEAMFPGKKIPGAGRTDETRWAEELQGQSSNDAWSWDGLRYEGSESSDITGGEQFEKIEGELVWLDPVVYREFVSKESERTPTGELPVGWKAIEGYPIGCCVARIGSTVLDLYPSDKNKCWSMCVYGLREHALHGAGTNSLIGPCNTINDLNAYIQANNYYNAAPREFIRQGAISGNQLPSIGTVGVVTMQFNEERPIVGHAYDKAPATSLAPDVYAFRENQRGSLQEHAGTSSLSMQGAADFKALGTATGVEAARDQAVGRMIPNLKLKTDMEQEWCYQVGELERENCSPEMFLSGAGKGSEKGDVSYTERGVRAFFNSDIRKDFRIRPVDGSWVPTTPMQDKANATEFGMIASRVQDPEMLALLAPRYGLEYSVNEWGAAEKVAGLRIREWARIVATITQGGFPASPELVGVVFEMSPEWARPNPEMDKHEAFRDYLEDWWASDEGLEADPLLRMVVQAAHLEHGKGIVFKAQLEQVGAIAAQEPAMAAQQEQAQQQIGMQQEAQQAEMAMQAEGAAMELERQAAENELSAADREHKLVTAVADREHKAEMRGE